MDDSQPGLVDPPHGTAAPLVVGRAALRRGLAAPRLSSVGTRYAAA